MKHKLIKIAASLMVILIFSILGLYNFVQYGASNCDANGKSCGCFCCNSFGLRGYEACGNYGLLVGVGVGLIVVLILYLVVKKYEKK